MYKYCLFICLLYMTVLYSMYAFMFVRFVSRAGCVVIVRAVNKLQFTSVCLIYLDSDARLQMCHFHHCMCVSCVSSFHRQGASFLSAGWRRGECRAECLVPVHRHGQSFWGWALPPRGENKLFSLFLLPLKETVKPTSPSTCIIERGGRL